MANFEELLMAPLWKVGQKSIDKKRRGIRKMIFSQFKINPNKMKSRFKKIVSYYNYS